VPLKPVSRTRVPPALFKAKLSDVVAANQLESFYTPAAVDAVVERVMTIDWEGLAAAWRLPLEMACDLCSLALYDVVLYCDDSGERRHVHLRAGCWRAFTCTHSVQ